MTALGDEEPPAQPAVRSLEAADGTPLLYRAWEVDRPRACVRIVHGLGEHGGRYAHLAEALAAHGMSVYAPDLRGHGVSGGRRGHVRRFDDFLSDLEGLRQTVLCEAPAFLFGHSLGGLIALRAVETGRAGALAGLILSAPALALAGPAPRWREPAAAILSRVTPTLELSNGIDPEDLSRAPEAVAAYRSDPLVHDRITPRLFSSMRVAMRSAAAEAERVELPVLLMLPGEDRIVDTGTAREVASDFRGAVQICEYPDYFHEPLHELQPGQAIAEILSWVNARIG